MDVPHLRDLRQRAVMSQEQLAERSGVARDTISKLETGRRRAYPTTIRKLAAGLEVEPRLLIEGVEHGEEGAAETAGRSGEGEEVSRHEPEGDRKIGF